jgi:RimJ/RimL family protein N-acetyltransferase
MYEMNKKEYHLVRGVLQPLSDFQPFCNAVLAGVFPGRVFVDDQRQPSSAFLVTRENWCFLAGNPERQSFNQMLNQAIFERQIIDQQTGALMFTCHPADWGGRLSEVFSPRAPVLLERRHYTSQQLHLDWRQVLPPDFELRFVGPGSMTLPGMEVPGQLQGTLDTWVENTHPLFKDYGFVAIYNRGEAGGRVAAFATVDGVANGSGDLGFETQVEFRRQGLGTAVAAAAIEYGLANGVNTIHWTCMQTNQGSIRTAEKLGLQRHADYQMHLLIFDEAGQYAQMAHFALEKGEYNTTLDLCERFFALQENPPDWAHLDAARAWAALDQPEKAFVQLQLAVQKGWRLDKEANAYPELVRLQELPGWQALLLSVRE